MMPKRSVPRFPDSSAKYHRLTSITGDGFSDMQKGKLDKSVGPYEDPVFMTRVDKIVSPTPSRPFALAEEAIENRNKRAHITLRIRNVHSSDATMWRSPSSYLKFSCLNLFWSNSVRTFEKQPPKVPYKAIGLAVVLFLVGTTLIVVGALLLTGIISAKYADRTWPVLILGALMFIPGAYHVRIAYYAYKGYQGYSYEDIPEFD